MELIVSEYPKLIIGAQGLEEIKQNIAMIVSTPVYSCPLDRSFASSAAFLDAPNPLQAAKKIAELTEIIEKQEPRVKVKNISFVPKTHELMQGKLYPKITFELKGGGL